MFTTNTYEDVHTNTTHDLQYWKQPECPLNTDGPKGKSWSQQAVLQQKLAGTLWLATLGGLRGTRSLGDTSQQMPKEHSLSQTTSASFPPSHPMLSSEPTEKDKKVVYCLSLSLKR